MTEYVQFKGNNPFGSQSKMLYHLDRVYEYITKGDTYPILMEINLTSKCNLGCEWCISANFNRKDTIRTAPLIKFLKEFKDKGGHAVTFSGGGEPTLHPDFLTIIKEAKKMGLHLGLMTNGVYPTEYNEVIGNSFDWVRFSLDVLNPKKYEKWKGIDKSNKVLSNIKRLHVRKYTCKVGVNCNIFKDHTLKDIQDLILYTRGHSDYIQFRPVLPRYFRDEDIYINKEIWDWLLEYSTYNDYINLSNDKYEDVVHRNFFDFSVCDGHFFEPILDANGNICVCMYHPDDDRFVFGNIYKNTYEEIWNSNKRKKVIDFVRKLDYKKECQACCKLTEINKFLDFINHPEKGTDINFL